MNRCELQRVAPFVGRSRPLAPTPEKPVAFPRLESQRRNLIPWKAVGGADLFPWLACALVLVVAIGAMISVVEIDLLTVGR